MKTKIIIGFLLFLIFAGALFLRVYFPWDNVFSDPIKYAADDGVYHMRIVENLLLGGHYPQKIYFDPFTYFPYGTYIHFAPLYDQLLAGIIWIAALGRPTLELIDKIAPLYPAVLGALTAIVIYFIGKALWGRWAGLFSAFLMAISQPFLFRSLLGATDHHQAEVLFSGLAILFLILALKYNQERKKLIIYTILAGIGMGLFFLTWIGALLFLFIIFTAIILYYLIEYISGRIQSWILAMGSVIFLLTLAMISPFFGHPDLLHSPLYNVIHLGALSLGAFIFLFILWLGIFLKKKNINKIYFPGFLLVAGLAIILIVEIVFPSLFRGIIESFQTVNVGLTSQQGVTEWRGSARDLIGEMRPMSIQEAFSAFGPLLYFSFIAWGFFIYNFARKRKPEDLFIALWFLAIISITGILTSNIGQVRFVYYLAALISLFSGFLAVKVIGYAVSCFKISKISLAKNHLRAASAVLIFNVIFFVFYPFPLNLIDSFPRNLPNIVFSALGTAISGGIGREADLYDALKWLRENTPDPGLDYYALYEEPKYNPETGQVSPYPYPETAYGVMSSWDNGHMITYYAHRIPNANPFQQGLGKTIGEGSVFPGETTFFIENDEEKAVKFLDELRTRYVLTDFGAASGYGGFAAKSLWAQGDLKGYYLGEGESAGAVTRKYDKSMIVRLHFFDGREWRNQEEKGEESYVKYLDRFRLVYESKTAVAPSFFTEETGEDDNNIRMIKIFEYVPGAKFSGFVPWGSEIAISAAIVTNQGREFVYKKKTESANGRFEFTVPYPGAYQLSINGRGREINVSEKDVLEGRIINL